MKKSVAFSLALIVILALVPSTFAADSEVDQMSIIAAEITSILSPHSQSQNVVKLESKPVPTPQPVPKPVESPKKPSDDEDAGIDKLASQVLKAMEEEKKKKETAEVPKPVAQPVTETKPKAKEEHKLTIDEKFDQLVAQMMEKERQRKAAANNNDAKIEKLATNIMETIKAHNQLKKTQSNGVDLNRAAPHVENNEKKLDALVNNVIESMKKDNIVQTDNVVVKEETVKETRNDKKLDALVNNVIESMKKDNIVQTGNVVIEETTKPKTEYGFDVSAPLKTSNRCAIQLAQTIPALKNLVSAASNNDIQKVKKEYELLEIVSHSLNILCHGSFSLELKPKQVSIAAEPCENQLTKIQNIGKTVSDNSVAKTEVIKAVQDIFVQHAGFVQNCLNKNVVVEKSKPVVHENIVAKKVEVKMTEDGDNSIGCVSSYNEVSIVIKKISDRVNSQPFNTPSVKDLRRDLEQLLYKVDVVNIICDARSKINLDQKKPVIDSTCEQDYQMVQAVSRYFQNVNDNSPKAIAETALKMVFLRDQMKNHC